MYLIKKKTDEIEFICPKYGTKEKFSTEVVEIFDSMDFIDADISYPLDLTVKNVMENGANSLY